MTNELIEGHIQEEAQLIMGLFDLWLDTMVELYQNPQEEISEQGCR